MTNARDIAWDGCLNLRELGGLPTRDGRVTASGAFIRGDSVCYLSDAGREALRTHGVRSIVDLRRQKELDEQPNPFASVSGIAYVNAPITDDAVEERLRTLADGGERYVAMVDGGVHRFGAALTALAHAQAPTVFHCFSGRDRTGIVAGLLLRLVGVPDEAILADYALTDERLSPRYETWRTGWDDAQRERFARTLAERTRPLAVVLDHVDRRYGGVTGLLRAAGVAEPAIARLRAKLLGDVARLASP